jgi:hypothetical protein
LAEAKLRAHLAYLPSEAERAVNRGLAESLAAERVTVEQARSEDPHQFSV